MNKKIIFIPFLILLFSFFTFDDVLEQLLQKTDHFNFENPQEKAYLHTDKPYYTAGETIWFKSYLVEGMTHLRDTVSVPLYVDLIDLQKQKIIDSKILQLDKGVGSGEFALADSLQGGSYRLRAYTNWMKNYGEREFFQKDLHVFEFGTDQITNPEPSTEVNFDFFPEGGYLVEDIQSRVAFKAADKRGMGVKLKGAILDSSGDTVTTFEPQHLGMGMFNFTPMKDQKYRAVLIINNVARKEIALPKAEPKGYVLTVDNFSNAKNLRVYLMRNTVATPEEVVLLAQCQGKVVYSGKVTLNKPASAVLIPKDIFPSGVIKLTLFDKNANPLCERLVFEHLNKTPSVSFNLTKNTFKKRGKNSVEIQVTDAEGMPADGEFSVSVLDKNQIRDQDDQRHIRSYLLLESEVKGYIENPAAYFNSTNTKAAVYLDLLLMTQGWRRFSWNEMLNFKDKVFQYPIERGLTIGGEITKLNGKNFEKPVTITMMATRQDSITRLFFTETELDGTYNFLNLDLKDSVRILLQAVAGNKRNTHIIVRNSNFTQIDLVRFPYRPMSFEAHDMAAYLKLTGEILELEKKLRLDKVIMLDEFVVKGKKADKLKDRRTLYGQPDASVKVTENMYGHSNILDVLRGRVAGVNVTGNVFEPSVNIRGISSLSGSNEPAFVLDGMVVDKSLILSIPVSDVEVIDVLKGPSAAIYGSRGGNGAISILTKKGNPDYDWKNDTSPGIRVFKWRGYSTPRTFYAPKYDQDFPGSERPDFRSTVYWNPAVRTDLSGKATFEYFNTDNEGDFEIYLEGLTSGGQPVAARKIYAVK